MDGVGFPVVVLEVDGAVDLGHEQRYAVPLVQSRPELVAHAATEVVGGGMQPGRVSTQAACNQRQVTGGGERGGEGSTLQRQHDLQGQGGNES